MIKSGDYQYILLTDGTAELTNYTAYAEFLTVPAQIDGHAVTSIGSEAFINSEFLSSIILPDCLTTIGIDAFCGCSFHTSITLPNSLTSIGNGAFAGCESLTRSILPSSLTSIEAWAFSGCESLASITLPDSLTTIGNWAFKSYPVSLNFTAVRGSWAESWCKENGKNYTYSNSID